ncbi:MAG: DNA polymerase III subunit gamma/tau [Halomonas sp.]|uniref:DNA polymerase III subunit gamma/tau n=1 Tax=Halomonas sp. TaxID=1486246 RepID=UPI003F8F6B92
MSYQVLARKWRPRTFRELVGQDHVQRALVNALDQGRLHHAYLFTGTRGVGKTTLARILAKCLNCTAGGKGDEGVTSTPCGECPNCQAIDQGRFVDLIEVDAASRTKVEDTRELLDNVQYLPTQGRYKVYLIDEVHMLSTSSFNALLKTLEEPPPHVKFLLATTDPQKLPATVLSRCLQFTLKHMPPEKVVGHLSQVLEAEQIPFEESALWLLGKAADGSMRDAMSLTDQAIAFGQGEIHHADVAAMLGTLDHRHVLALIEALASTDAAMLLAEVARLAEQGPDFAGVLDDVTGVLHRLAVAQMVPEAVDNSHGDRDELLALAARFTAEDIQLYYQIGVQGRGDMAHAPDLRSALEMTLLRMLAFRPQGVPKPADTPLPMRGEGGSAGSSPGESKGPSESGSQSQSHRVDPTPATEMVPEPEITPESEQTAQPEPAAQSETQTGTDPHSLPPWVEQPSDDDQDGYQEGHKEIADSVFNNRSAAEPEATIQPKTAPESKPQPEADLQPITRSEVQPETQPQPIPDTDSGPPESARLDHAQWLALFESLGLTGLTRNLAAHCVVASDDGSRVLLKLSQKVSAMRAEVHERRIQKALSEAGYPRQLVVDEGELPDNVQTPQQQAERVAAERHAWALDALRNDPHVQQLKDTFGARIEESSVQPVSH